MALPNRIQRIFRRPTDAECIERARKVVRLDKKWGKSIGVFYCLLSVLLIAAAIGFGCIVWMFAQMPGHPQNAGSPQPHDMMWLGFSLGLALGFIAGYFLFKGAHVLGQGIAFLGGDRNSELLVRYLDGIKELMEKEREIAEQAQEKHGAVDSSAEKSTG